jgi:hypothetical protein
MGTKKRRKDFEYSKENACHQRFSKVQESQWKWAIIRL